MAAISLLIPTTAGTALLCEDASAQICLALQNDLNAVSAKEPAKLLQLAKQRCVKQSIEYFYCPFTCSTATGEVSPICLANVESGRQIGHKATEAAFLTPPSETAHPTEKGRYSNIFQHRVS